MNKTIYCLLLITVLQASALLKAQSFDWVHFYEATPGGSCTITTIVDDSQGNILTGGFFTKTVDFDPGPGTYSITESPTTITTLPGIGDGFVMLSDTNGNTLWVKTFAGYGSLGPVYTEIDESGNILILAHYLDSVDVDPGPGVFLLTGSGRCIIKLDGSGNFLWVKSFSDTTGYFRINKILAGKNGDIWISCGVSDSLDVDPGPGIFMMVNPSVTLTAGVVVRLNTNGDFVNAFFSGYNLNGPDIAIGNSGDIWVLNYFYTTFDFDPGPGSVTLNPFDGNYYLQHLDSAGNFISVLQLEFKLFKIALDSTGGILLAGQFEGQVDADPGPGTYLLNSNGSFDICLIRLDTAGNFSWAGNIGSPTHEQIYGLTMGSDGNIYLNGSFSDFTDFDPGPGLYEYGYWTSTGTNYILKLDSAGKFIMVFPLTGNASSISYLPLLVLPSGSFYYCDWHNGLEDFDPGMGYQYMFTIWSKGYMLKMKPDICGLLTFQTTMASDVKCSQPGAALCTVMSGSPPFQYLWNNVPPSTDSIANVNSPGQYTVTVTDSAGCVQSSTVYVSGPAYFTQVDMEANMGGSALRINESTPILIDATNNGCMPVWGNLVLHLDPRVIIDSVFPAPVIIIGDSMMWFSQALTYDSLPYTVQLFMSPDSTVNLGDSLCFTVSTEPPLNDADTLNNLKNYCLHVIGSFDPNIKLAYPTGSCDDHFILPESEITYTILFQNTGNAPAFNVLILDTLSPFLDLNSFRIDAVSHPVLTHILPGNVLKFEFQNIMLPDSGSNLPASNGYIVFSCQIDSAISSGTLLSNSAIILFDYNEYIITDSVYHTVVNAIPYPDTSITVLGATLTASQAQATYQWIDCTNGGVIISGANGQAYTPQINGSYAVMINQNGCTAISSCHNIFSVGENEITNKGGVLLYPNPGQDYVIVESNFISESFLEVYNVYGELLFSGSFMLKTKLDTGILAPGLYLCRIRNNNSEVISGYFIKN